MALFLDHVAPNGSKGNYFRISRIEGICAPRELDPRWEVWVNFYADKDIRAQNTDPMFRYIIRIPFSDLTQDPRSGVMASFYSVLKNYPPFAGQAVVDIIEDSPNIALDVAKAAKYNEINSARLAANQSSFTYAGEKIACDTLSRSDIDGTNGYISLMGEFPQGWVGQWKTISNTYVPIATINDWKLFYAAMVDQGQANFMYAQGLKQVLASTTAVNQVNSIFWGIDLKTFVLPQPIIPEGAQDSVPAEPTVPSVSDNPLPPPPAPAPEPEPEPTPSPEPDPATTGG